MTRFGENGRSRTVNWRYGFLFLFVFRDGAIGNLNIVSKAPFCFLVLVLFLVFSSEFSAWQNLSGRELVAEGAKQIFNLHGCKNPRGDNTG
jgi:hypothetical protein